MRIVTFNIHHGTIAKTGPVDPDRLAEVCEGFDADVLALQEVDLGTYRTHRADLAAVVARACGMEYVFGASRWFPGGRYGNALLVRGELRAWSVVPLPRVPSWQRWQERRIAIEALVHTGDVTLTVTATHLAVPRAVNTVQLRALLDRAAAAPHPSVVLGDLNLRPSIVKPAAVAAGFTLAKHGPSNPVPDPVRGIDHVLVSPGITITGAEVRPTEMSDHAAVLVDIDVDLAAAAAAPG